MVPHMMTTDKAAAAVVAPSSRPLKAGEQQEGEDQIQPHQLPFANQIPDDGDHSGEKQSLPRLPAKMVFP